MGASVIAIVCGLVCGIGLVLVASPWFAPAPVRRSWGPWRRLSEEVSRARVPGLSAARLVALSLVVGAVVWVAILALTGAWPVALIVALGVAFLPYAWVVSRVAAHAKTVRAAWPEVVDAMVSGVRAGTSLPQVLCELADEGPQPLRFAFDAFSRDYSANGRFASALDRMKDEVRDPVADRIVEALRIARSVGGADLTPPPRPCFPPSRGRASARRTRSTTVVDRRGGAPRPRRPVGGASASVRRRRQRRRVEFSGWHRGPVCGRGNVRDCLPGDEGAGTTQRGSEEPGGREMNPWAARAVDAVVSALAASGIACIVMAWLDRRPSFVTRVAQGRVSDTRPSALGAWIRRCCSTALESMGSTSESVARRLSLAGMNMDVPVFRLRQALAAIVGLVLSCALLTLRSAASLRSSLVALCVCALLASLLGVTAMDRALSIKARRRQRAIDAAVPDCAELLALAVAAGESIPAAIERVAGCAGGPLGSELALTSAHIRNGTPSVRALAKLVERTDSPSLTRLSRTLTTAIERGSPLASVLHDQARDQRERSLASLMEEGGRREIAMLLPVVFLILPVTVMFALYPGLIALDFTP